MKRRVGLSPQMTAVLDCIAADPLNGACMAQIYEAMWGDREDGGPDGNNAVQVRTVIYDIRSRVGRGVITTKIGYLLSLTSSGLYYDDTRSHGKARFVRLMRSRRGQVVTLDEIASVLWPGRTKEQLPRNWRHCISIHVLFMRKELKEEIQCQRRYVISPEWLNKLPPYMDECKPPLYGQVVSEMRMAA